MTETLRDRLIGAWALVDVVEEPVDGWAPRSPQGDGASHTVARLPGAPHARSVSGPHPVSRRGQGVRAFNAT